ncbi:hypothetical protein ACQ4PT_059829 [Festuca glaucescens]
MAPPPTPTCRRTTRTRSSAAACTQHTLGYLCTAISVFDTVSEQFRTMRLPPEESETTSRSKIIWNLAPIDGALGAWSFAEFEHRVLRMWVLEDHEEERWALRYRVDLRLLEGDPLTFVGRQRRRGRPASVQRTRAVLRAATW